MRTLMSPAVSRPLAAMLLTIALALPVAAHKPAPFKGAFQGVEIDTPLGGPPPTTLSVTGNVTGIGSLVGQFSLTYQYSVTLATASGTGYAVLTAANGDTISLSVTGTSEPTGTPGVNSITEIHTITGGTGRFAGATGSIIVERLLDLATGSTSGSFHGTITSPGSTH